MELEPADAGHAKWAEYDDGPGTSSSWSLTPRLRKCFLQVVRDLTRWVAPGIGCVARSNMMATELLHCSGGCGDSGGLEHATCVLATRCATKPFPGCSIPRMHRSRSDTAAHSKRWTVTVRRACNSCRQQPRQNRTEDMTRMWHRVMINRPGFQIAICRRGTSCSTSNKFLYCSATSEAGQSVLVLSHPGAVVTSFLM